MLGAYFIEGRLQGALLQVKREAKIPPLEDVGLELGLERQGWRPTTKKFLGKVNNIKKERVWEGRIESSII